MTIRILERGQVDHALHDCDCLPSHNAIRLASGFNPTAWNRGSAYDRLDMRCLGGASLVRLAGVGCCSSAAPAADVEQGPRRLRRRGRRQRRLPRPIRSGSSASWSSSCATTRKTGSAAITESLRVLHPEFKDALAALGEDNLGAAIVGLTKLRESADPYLAADASYFLGAGLSCSTSGSRTRCRCLADLQGKWADKTAQRRRSAVPPRRGRSRPAAAQGSDGLR